MTPDPRDVDRTFARTPGRENQLTSEIARLCALDPELAQGFTEALIAVADATSGQRLTQLRARVPKGVTITNELRLGPRRDARWRPSGGRVDWSLSGPGFEVLVEVKIGSEVRPGQLERYLAYDGFRDCATVGGLILLTRVREPVPKKVWSHPCWLGQVSWNELVPALHEVSAGDPAILRRWQSLLSQAERPGDLADNPVAWQRGKLTAGQRNSQILKAVLDSACQTVERALADRKGWNRSEGLCSHRRPDRTRSVTVAKDMAQFGLYRQGKHDLHPVITVALSGSRRPFTLTTNTEIGHPPLTRPKRRRATVAELTAAGFTVSGERCSTVDRIGPTAGSAVPESPTTVVRNVLADRLTTLVTSGALDGFAPRFRRAR